MPRCKGIINLHDRSKLKCNNYTSDPIKFINDHVNSQAQDVPYIYNFDGSKYISIHNGNEPMIHRLNDPIKLAISWHAYAKHIGGDYNTIVNELNLINELYFGSRYPINKTIHIQFLNHLDNEYKNTPHKYKLIDIINTSITLIKNPSTSADMASIIAIMYYILTADIIGTMIAIRSVNNFETL